MKKILFVFTLISLCGMCLGQQKSYINKTIGNWTFEKFPVHYYIPPVKTNKETNIITGKLEYYTEIDKTGERNGLSLTMNQAGLNPNHATYTFKGATVYVAFFFPNSNIIERVENMNEKGDFDGPQFVRTKKENGGYTEEVTIYKDGILTEVNGSKFSEPVFNKDSLLEGSFKFQNTSGDFFEGKANNGEITYLKNYSMDKYAGIYNIVELTFTNDSIIENSQANPRGGIYTSSYFIKSKAKITNSKKLYCTNNNSEYSYLYFSKSFTYLDLLEKMKQKKLIEIKDYMDAANNIENFNSSLVVLEKSLENLKSIIIKFEKVLSNSDNNKLRELIIECEKKIDNKKIEDDRNASNEKEVASIEEKKKKEATQLKSAMDSLTNKQNILYSIISEYKDNLKIKPECYISIEEFRAYTTEPPLELRTYYKGQVVKKNFINIYKAYILMLNDCANSNKSLTGSEIAFKKSEITEKYITLCKSDNNKSIDKQLNEVKDITTILKIIYSN